MQQWTDETLVAIHQMENKKFKVVELPARETEMITSRRSFHDYEQAEDYVANQYPTALRVEFEDIMEEIENRKASKERYTPFDLTPPEPG